MKEEFLHFVWKYGLYDKKSLVTPEGYPIVVVHPGDYNRDSGPDFFNARIKYDGTEWAGNVEIHTKASHFVTHGHNTDHSYDNLILHAVGEKDRDVFNAAGSKILTVEVKPDIGVYEKYMSLINNPYTIACQEEIGKVNGFILNNWINSLLIERLAGKCGMIKKIFEETGNDWEETFYRLISRYFGFRVNTDPFLMLASALPFKIIRKHLDNRMQVEALLFGTAGMLEEELFREAINDEYFRELAREFRVFSAKYSIKPVHGWIWKFSKLRPVNFPTVRISQLAAMLTVTGGLFSRVIEAENMESLRKLFSVSASKYWDNHYVFGKESKKAIKNTGENATDIFMINAVIPILFAYGKAKGNNEICERALDFLESIEPEQNRIIREWSEAGVTASSASDTQGLIHLREEYCRKRRCLECRIGLQLISTGSKLKDNDELILEP
ncbi:MAG TPA: DUF2851 family protein [Bacteroidales bacterium]|nr:DUF2851 family protein [Bacteroidales bacterium]HQG36637.1 DUF2851 family protein [Bacteroidales bacterium]HQG52770.1 DUF2851 family protein [Bacteroidales bacterium]HQJ20778.1 DUF2851 family protein [Bacteroidales bacterium]